MTTVNWATKVISVPQSDLTLVSGSVYELDVDVFRLALRDLEDDEEGIAFLPTHAHNTEVVLSGVTYARILEIINGYTVTFEDGQYAVNLIGANNNIADVANVNQVSIRPSNSAGLVALSSSDIGGLAAAVRSALINTRLDQITYDQTTGALTAARRRYFADSVTAGAATPGGSGEGEDVAVTISAVPGSEAGRIDSYAEIED